MKIYLPTFEDLSGSRTGSSACTAVSYRLCRTWPWTCGCFKPTLPDLAGNLSKSLHIKGQPNSVLVHYNPWVGQQLIAFVSHIIASKFGSKLWTRNSTSSFQSLVGTPSWFVFTINVISSLGQYQLRAWTYSQETGTYNLSIDFKSFGERSGMIAKVLRHPDGDVKKTKNLSAGKERNQLTAWRTTTNRQKDTCVQTESLPPREVTDF